MKQSERGYYKGRIPDEDKVAFINGYWADFMRIYVESGSVFEYGQHNERFNKLAVLAKKELGYSQKTAAVDICRVLYDKFIKIKEK